MQALEDEGWPIVEWNTGSPARMVPACAKFYDAVMEQRVTHDGDPRLARHVDHCVLKVDAKGPRIVKEHRMSPRKIDLAVCAVIAHDRAVFNPEPESAPLVMMIGAST
jgi:phage terminase large subunit-like protein